MSSGSTVFRSLNIFTFYISHDKGHVRVHKANLISQMFILIPSMFYVDMLSFVNGLYQWNMYPVYQVINGIE